MKPDRSAPRNSVCIIIPVCNEAESIPQLHRRLQSLQRRLGRHFSVHYLFVDDGSVDETVHLLPLAVPKGVTYEVLVHPTNLGVGAAFRSGFRRAHADIVCTMDADCSYGPENLARMIDQVHSGAADIVVASPYHPQGTVEGVQAWRRLLSMQCSRLYRMVSPVKLYTYTSIFRAYRGSVVKDVEIRSDGFVAVVEILFSAARLGYVIAEKPLTLRRRITGVSKMRIARTMRDHLGLMLSCLRAGGRVQPQRAAPWLSAPSLKSTSIHPLGTPVARKQGASRS